jgi:hypothetical protein
MQEPSHLVKICLHVNMVHNGTSPNMDLGVQRFSHLEVPNQNTNIWSELRCWYSHGDSLILLQVLINVTMHLPIHQTNSGPTACLWFVCKIWIYIKQLEHYVIQMASNIEYHENYLTLIPINIQVYNTLWNQLGLRIILPMVFSIFWKYAKNGWYYVDPPQEKNLLLK